MTTVKGNFLFSWLRLFGRIKFLRFLLLILLICSQICVADYTADFDSADFQDRLSRFLGDLQPGEVDQLRRIWQLKDRATAYHPNFAMNGFLPGTGRQTFHNNAPHHLPYEFMDYFLFPEEYFIQVYPNDAGRDFRFADFIIDNLKFSDTDTDGGVKWVLRLNGDLVVGAGKSNVKHSILAGFAKNANLTPREKFERLVVPVHDGDGDINRNSLGHEHVLSAGSFSARKNRAYIPNSPKVIKVKNTVEQFLIPHELIGTKSPDMTMLLNVANILKKQAAAESVKLIPVCFKSF